MVFSLTVFFRYSLEHLFSAKIESLLSLGLHLNYKTRKRKTKRHYKVRNTVFMSEVLLTGLDVLNSCQNHSKNKLVSENAETQVHGSCLLRVMGSW